MPFYILLKKTLLSLEPNMYAFIKHETGSGINVAAQERQNLVLTNERP